MTVTKDRVFFIWVAAHCPRLAQVVSEAEMGARDSESRGEYRGLCGAVFLPAPDNQPLDRSRPA